MPFAHLVHAAELDVQEGVVYSGAVLLLVGLPAYNEAATIANVIATVPRELPGIDEVQVVVADDGSSDGTGDVAREAGATLVRHAQNSGVGAAFQTIYRHAILVGADILVTIDADGQFDPADIPRLIAPILEGRALVCTASRFSDQSAIPQMPWVKKWGNRRVAKLVSSIAGRQYADVSCGFRAYAAEALRSLTVYHSFTYTHETFLDLAIKRISIEEVPLRVRGTREFGDSKVAANVLRYGWRTGTIILRTYRDHRPLRLCAWLATPFLLGGLGLIAYSARTFLYTGSWVKWAAFTGAAGCALAIAFVFFGFMVDIATRLRQNQEEIIYWLRRSLDHSKR